MDRKIKILKKTIKKINGREVEGAADEYYSCWCTPLDLYGQEFYLAENNGYKNVLKFKVRFCSKIADMNKEMDIRNFLISYDDKLYEVYSIDFLGNSRDYVCIKANRVS